MKPIVLASGSPRRRELLAQIGLEFKVIPAKKEEEIRYSRPDQIVEDLSRQKAMEVAGQVAPGTIVIGSDTVVALDGQILGKPGTKEKACEMLTLLAGRTHQVYTGVTVIVTGENEETVTFCEKTDVRIYPMTQEEICRYVETGDPLDKAGAYGIQGTFAAYVEGISGSFYNVMGLPIGQLYQKLKGRMEG